MVTLVNRAKVSTSTTGTGTITLGAAADGYQTFSNAGVTDGQTVRYVIEDGSNFEIGSGVFGLAGGTLTRTVTESSNADAAINLSGTAVVFITATASDIVQPNDNVSVLTNDAGYTTNTGTVTSLAASAGTGISVSGSPITTSGTLTITNTAPDQTVVLTSGTGISATGTYPNFTVTNTAPDQTVSIASGTGISASGTYPNFTVTNTAPHIATNLTYSTASTTGTVNSSTGTNATLPAATTSLAGLLTGADKTKLDGIAAGATANTGTVTSVAASAGTGISISGSPIATSGTLTITNTAPDQTVVLTAGDNVTVTGTYPNFTIASTDTNTTYTAGNGLNLVGTEFSTIDIRKPTAISPDGVTDVSIDATLTASAYAPLYSADVRSVREFQLTTFSDTGYATPVFTSSVNADTVGVTPSLDLSTQYRWRCRDVAVSGATSAYSTDAVFTTSASIPGPTVIGETFGGGFYAGNIVEGGTEYYVIVAPKASGESAALKYKTTNTASPAATQTLNNGPAATAAMVSAGSHPAAAFCAGLSIGGFSDWYLPARDELELLYRNLKPTGTANVTSTRSLSAIIYPEGNDVSGDTIGRNRNSNPLGAGYASGDPAQTSVTAFVTGGAEAFALEFYFCSSEFSSTSAWIQGFSNGGQFETTKDGAGILRPVRAVRRIAV